MLILFKEKMAIYPLYLRAIGTLTLWSVLSNIVKSCAVISFLEVGLVKHIKRLIEHLSRWCQRWMKKKSNEAGSSKSEDVHFNILCH